MGLSDREEDDVGARGMSLSVRFTDGGEDLVDLWVGGRETVRDVKRRVGFFLSFLQYDYILLIDNCYCHSLGQNYSSNPHCRKSSSSTTFDPPREIINRRYLSRSLHASTSLSSSKIGQTTNARIWRSSDRGIGIGSGRRGCSERIDRGGASGGFGSGSEGEGERERKGQREGE